MVDNNTIRIYPSDADRIFSKREVVSNTTGFRGKKAGTNRRLFENADYIDVTFSGGVYGAYTKNARNENHFAISKIVLHKPTKVSFVKNASDFYFDSHITSAQDDPRAGYLGPVNKSGKITDTKGVAVTNTHDFRYMDAVQGDMFMSGVSTEGTGYDFSVTLPELLGFGQP
jgi:hypothetical protein